MKNLHILSAKNPQVSAKGQIYLATHDIPDTHYPIRLVRSEPNSPTSHRKECVRQELYITSDEEIKEGDWTVFISTNEITKVPLGNFKGKVCQKIILTTDQDLIKAGVQAIDDEFLEWFVKNPSCEEVEVKSEILYEHKDIYRPYPSECKNLIKTKVNYYLSIIPKEEPKQETLEEAAKKYASKNSCNRYNCSDLKFSQSFKLGAKWQQERSYSEEEVLKLLISKEENTKDSTKYNGVEYITPEEWFEQFKKK